LLHILVCNCDIPSLDGSGSWSLPGEASDLSYPLGAFEASLGESARVGGSSAGDGPATTLGVSALHGVHARSLTGPKVSELVLLVLILLA
jgi:hypothetical protein